MFWSEEQGEIFYRLRDKNLIVCAFKQNNIILLQKPEKNIDDFSSVFSHTYSNNNTIATITNDNVIFVNALAIFPTPAWRFVVFVNIKWL